MSLPADGYQLRIEGVNQPLCCSADKTVLQALTDGNIFLEANCGGRGVCGKCKIEVIQGKVAGLNSFPAIPLQNNSYLACQIIPKDNLLIRLKQAEVSTKGDIAEQVAVEGQPLVNKVVLTPEYPMTAPDGFPDKMLTSSFSNIPDTILKQFAEVAATTLRQITVVAINDEPVIIEPGDTADFSFGVAFDIGTTTVAGILLDLNAKKVVGTCAESNPQAAFGADVISRITATTSPGNLGLQAKVIRQCLNSIVQELCASSGVSPEQIYVASIAGNSTMTHLLMAISPLNLVCKPYTATFNYIEPFAPQRIGLAINAGGRVVLLPNVGGYIGADTTAAILAADQDIAPEQFLIVDLGTNGEMALGNRDKILVCSASVGSAFEGTHIRDGMRASAGAIIEVTIIDDEVCVKTIADSKPLGISGVGIVKAIAELRKEKIITANGRFDKEVIASMPPTLRNRLKQNNGQCEFVLVEGVDTATGYDISITQNDIRKIQLAKSAICTGIKILLKKANATPEPSPTMPVFLAGAFGNYIDIESALAIGMFPGFNRNQVSSIGNAAGVGAVHTLLSREKLDRCIRIPDKIELVELATHPDFRKKFVANLAFPEVI